MSFFTGAITQTKKLMGVSGSFITDDVNTYAVTSEVKIEESKNGVTYTPLVEIRRPEQENMALTGLVTLETPKAATVDLTLTGVTAQPMSLKSECWLLNLRATPIIKRSVFCIQLLVMLLFHVLQNKSAATHQLPF